MNQFFFRRNALSPHQPAGGGRAFTLIETILVLAVIALLGALLLPGVNSILKAINHEEPDRLFWNALTTARELALITNRTVALRFDDREKRLTWGDGASRRQQKLPEGVSIKFLQPKPGNAVLLGGVLLETDEILAVRIYPDGTCDRFRAQILQGNSPAQLILVDPWTCAPMFGLH